MQNTQYVITFDEKVKKYPLSNRIFLKFFKLSYFLRIRGVVFCFFGVRKDWAVVSGK